MTVYRVSAVWGTFDHVLGKKAALTVARRWAGAPPTVPEDELRKHWGVWVKPVSEWEAHSVGFRDHRERRRI